MPGWLFSNFGPIFGRSGPMFGQKSCKCCKAICPACAKRSPLYNARWWQRGNWQNGYLCLCTPQGLTGTVAGISPTLTASNVPVLDNSGTLRAADLTVATNPNGDYCLTVGEFFAPEYYLLSGIKCITGTITVNGTETGSLYGYYELVVIVGPDRSELPSGQTPNTADPGLVNVRVQLASLYLTTFSTIASRVPNEPSMSGGYFDNAPSLKPDGGASTHYLGPSIGTVRATLGTDRDGTSDIDWNLQDRQNGWCNASPNWAAFSLTNDLTSVPANRLGGTGGSVTVGGPCRTDCGNVVAICVPRVTAMCVEIFEATSSGFAGHPNWTDWTRTSGPTVVTLPDEGNFLPPPPWNIVTVGKGAGTTGCKARFVRVRPANSSGGCDPLDPPTKLTSSTTCPWGIGLGCGPGDPGWETGWLWTNVGTGVPHWVLNDAPRAITLGAPDPRTVYYKGGDPWQGQSGSSWSADKTDCQNNNPTEPPDPPSGFDKYEFYVACGTGDPDTDGQISGSRVGDMGVPNTGNTGWVEQSSDEFGTYYKKTIFVPTGSLKPAPGAAPC